MHFNCFFGIFWAAATFRWAAAFEMLEADDRSLTRSHPMRKYTLGCPPGFVYSAVASSASAAVVKTFHIGHAGEKTFIRFAMPSHLKLASVDVFDEVTQQELVQTCKYLETPGSRMSIFQVDTNLNFVDRCLLRIRLRMYEGPDYPLVENAFLTSEVVVKKGKAISKVMSNPDLC